MKNFQKIGAGINVLPLLHALYRKPQLWGQHKWRTEYAHTPHGEVDDIWLRYAPQSATSSNDDISKAVHDTAPVWYPAATELPQFRSLVLDIMRGVEAYELGRVLLTRMAPGKKILPHRDAGGAYTDVPDGMRYHVVLQGLPGSNFTCGSGADEETVCMQTGEVWSFNYREIHSVVNNSADDRIHLLIDTRNM